MLIGYVTLEEAKEFIYKRYDEDDIGTENFERALYLALDKIETLNIRNSGKNEEQELIFPRLKEKQVPKDVKIAQILEAYSISNLENNDYYEDIEKGIASRSINDMSISYNSETFNKNKIGNTLFYNSQAKDILFKYVRKTYDWS